ncbi:MAG: GlxA family transcriptional regulator [Hyphomicrobiales bacterium]
MDILVIVTANFNMAATSGFLDPFRAANYLDGQQHFRWSLISVDGGACMASNGMTIETESLSKVRGELRDLVIVSASWAPEKYTGGQLQSALRRWAREGTPLGAIDTGAFILARAGLLDGMRASVHYEHIDAMNEMFPAVEASEDLFVFDRNRMTCCGGVAAMDFALHIIRRSHGERLANEAARYVFHPSLRPEGSHQNSNPAEPLGPAPPENVRRAIKVMEENLEETIPISEICKRIELSQRQLDRLFAKHVGKTPALYYRDIRLDRARGLVTQTELPLAEVALASGFASHVHFSRAYRERFGLAPRTDRVEGRIPFEFRAWPMHRKKPARK